MPSPVGHILAGAAVYLAANRKNGRSGVTLSVTILGSILPDFDFLPGMIIGEPALFHHGISHSFAFALLYGVLVFAFVHFFHKPMATRAAVAASLAYGSHLILDVVSVNAGSRGILLMWPLSSERFGINLFLFGHFRHAGFRQGIWSVVRWDNLFPVMRELVVVGSPVLLLWLRRGRRPRRDTDR